MRHGTASLADNPCWYVDDPDMWTGLSMSIEQWLDAHPCPHGDDEDCECQS
jgi:hypothetical protein